MTCFWILLFFWIIPLTCSFGILLRIYVICVLKLITNFNLILYTVFMNMIKTKSERIRNMTFILLIFSCGLLSHRLWNSWNILPTNNYALSFGHVKLIVGFPYHRKILRTGLHAGFFSSRDVKPQIQNEQTCVLWDVEYAYHQWYTWSHFWSYNGIKECVVLKFLFFSCFCQISVLVSFPWRSQNKS